MKILRVIASMDPETGGPCQGIRNSIPALKALGCENEVVSFDSKDAPFVCREEFPIHALGSGITPLSFNFALLPWMEANLERFDAVIVHGLWLWPSIATWIAMQRLSKKAQRLGIPSTTALLNTCRQLLVPKIPPYCVMPHGMLDPWFQKSKGRRLKSLRNLIYWKLIEHRVIRDAQALLFTCEEELRLARKTFRPYEPHQEFNVGYGVPPPPPPCATMQEAFHVGCPDLPSAQPYLLFLGRIHPKKGVDLLIRAYTEVFEARLKAQCDNPVDGVSQIPAFSSFSPSPKADTPLPTNPVPALVIAGPIDSNYAQEMICLAESLLRGSVFSPTTSNNSRYPITKAPFWMNRPSIHFTGMLQGNAKWGAIHGCQSLILPSHQENFAISVAEALSCGKPVLISNKVNIFKEVEIAGAGIVDRDDDMGLATLLQKWNDLDDLERQKMSQNALQLFQKRFLSTTTAIRLLEVLKKITLVS